MNLGYLDVEGYLRAVGGDVRGVVVTDAKRRSYSQHYAVTEDGSDLLVRRSDGHGDQVRIAKRVPLDEALVSFFGLYSGDGTKGSDDPAARGEIRAAISFSQKEPNLVRFAVDQFRRLFPRGLRFTFSLGEDSAYFMDGEGADALKTYYKGTIPSVPTLAEVRPKLNEADEEYLKEVRPEVAGAAHEHLSFYYAHQGAMEKILATLKQADLAGAGIAITANDRVTASLRRPFKKGARQPGGSSRSDEIHLGGLNGFAELFLKMMHEIEDSLLRDSAISTSGLVRWDSTPSQIGQVVDISEFFRAHPYGQVGGERPTIEIRSETHLRGRWPRSSDIRIVKALRLTPLWCYTSGLYLAEGSTSKATFFQMSRTRPSGLALGFTSSEGASIELMLRALHSLFGPGTAIDSWKVKVGSQYFPELVVTANKQGVVMLRGGERGEGKLRTMEVSLPIRDWALALAEQGWSPSLLATTYATRYSHVEPTGSGVARIDFHGSSASCRWYFPLVMYAVFGTIVPDPSVGFYR